MSKRPPLDATALAQFTGSERYYRHPFVNGITFTEGAKYVADTAGAYWLLDEIALANRFELAVMTELFQVWDLIVSDDCSASLVCGDGDRAEIYTKRIEWTDFPFPGIRFYFCYGCIHLPSEY